MASKRSSTGSSSEDSDSDSSPSDIDSESLSGSDEHRNKRRPRSRTRPKSFKRRRDRSSSSSRSESSPGYGNHKESKRSKRGRSYKSRYVEYYSSSQSERTKSKTKPKHKSMPKYKKNKHKKKKSKTKKQSKEHHNESPTYYTVLLKIDKNENRDAVLFENQKSTSEPRRDWQTFRNKIEEYILKRNPSLSRSRPTSSFCLTYSHHGHQTILCEETWSTFAYFQKNRTDSPVLVDVSSNFSLPQEVRLTGVEKSKSSTHSFSQSPSQIAPEQPTQQLEKSISK